MRSPISRKKAPRSSNAAIRSRAVIFPALCCRSTREGPPPRRRRASSFCSCSTSRRICAWRAASTLFDLREVGRVHEDRDHLVDDLAIFLGVGGHLFPFGIGAEVRPVLLGLIAAGVGNDVDQRSVLAFVLR